MVEVEDVMAKARPQQSMLSSGWPGGTLSGWEHVQCDINGHVGGHQAAMLAHTGWRSGHGKELYDEYTLIDFFFPETVPKEIVYNKSVV